MTNACLLFLYLATDLTGDLSEKSPFPDEPFKYQSICLRRAKQIITFDSIVQSLPPGFNDVQYLHITWPHPFLDDESDDNYSDDETASIDVDSDDDSVRPSEKDGEEEGFNTTSDSSSDSEGNEYKPLTLEEKQEMIVDAQWVIGKGGLNEIVTYSFSAELARGNQDIQKAVHGILAASVVLTCLTPSKKRSSQRVSQELTGYKYRVDLTGDLSEKSPFPDEPFKYQSICLRRAKQIITFDSIVQSLPPGFNDVQYLHITWPHPFLDDESDDNYSDDETASIDVDSDDDSVRPSEKDGEEEGFNTTSDSSSDSEGNEYKPLTLEEKQEMIVDAQWVIGKGGLNEIVTYSFSAELARGNQDIQKAVHGILAAIASSLRILSIHSANGQDIMSIAELIPFPLPLL
ncbi:uncharacterized protein LACBIDRAFT_332234 [Laccaria bicolor S238N-H82]|uniref:Predicted protein n=1 Tax=Laccaria bicolor (strain S238N-H82 / ATCC MYA-4686) TaxID=486041 RepID=B0DS19_LACBS|nr:uncharacterized protein LACBIDRAFT_332234 [Laccaria bicolor S238N-H82]EDR02712.1 predicted protein [Laccaria bicolor S238N-H82]|eukprot:XP_001886756.1 predicted protein [Laccaria bicolor S238N-H82]